MFFFSMDDILDEQLKMARLFTVYGTIDCFILRTLVAQNVKEQFPLVNYLIKMPLSRIFIFQCFLV
jgi:hypothetical protein